MPLLDFFFSSGLGSSFFWSVTTGFVCAELSAREDVAEVCGDVCCCSGGFWGAGGTTLKGGGGGTAGRPAKGGGAIVGALDTTPEDEFPATDVGGATVELALELASGAGVPHFGQKAA